MYTLCNSFPLSHLAAMNKQLHISYISHDYPDNFHHAFHSDQKIIVLHVLIKTFQIMYLATPRNHFNISTAVQLK